MSGEHYADGSFERALHLLNVLIYYDHYGALTVIMLSAYLFYFVLPSFLL
jgi:hypothetical protein